MPKSEIRNLEASEYDIWDNFAAGAPRGTIFHKSCWLKASGRDFRIYGYFKGGELFAGLPIVCDISRKLGFRTGSNPPLTSYLGLIFNKKVVKYETRISEEKKISSDIALRLKEDFDSISFNFTPDPVDLQPFIWEGFSSKILYTYIIDLDDLDNVWDRMNSKRRNDIIRAEKDGICVERNVDFGQVLALAEKSFKRQEKSMSFKNTAIKYNEAISQKGQCSSFLAKNVSGKPIASVYIVWDEKKSYYIIGGYDSQESHHGASAMAIWEAIKFSKQELGLSQFDFEGSMIQSVESFFRKFGGRLTPYYSVSWHSPSVKFAQNARKLVNAGLSKLNRL